MKYVSDFYEIRFRFLETARKRDISKKTVSEISETGRIRITAVSEEFRTGFCFGNGDTSFRGPALEFPAT